MNKLECMENSIQVEGFISLQPHPKLTAKNLITNRHHRLLGSIEMTILSGAPHPQSNFYFLFKKLFVYPYSETHSLPLGFSGLSPSHRREDQNRTFHKNSPPYVVFDLNTINLTNAGLDKILEYLASKNKYMKKGLKKS